MRKILVVLVISLLVITVTATGSTRRVIAGSLELQLDSNDEAMVGSEGTDQTSIKFDITKLKPGETLNLDWTLKNVGKTRGVIDYLRIKAIQDGGVTNQPESIVDPDNSGDLGSLLICTLSYDGEDYVLPMDEVLSPEGMIYNPGIVLKPEESTTFRLTVYWPNHSDDNIGQGDTLTAGVDMRLTQLE
jgi:hypothetical protein